MSTIKSSDESITINADGSGNDIKFQANGVEKASISSAGAFTSTTIDATKLTGALPAISGAALTGVGVAGISSSADATAITIDSSENVGIGTTTPVSTLEVAKSDQTNGAILSITNKASTSGWDTDDTIGTINFRTNDTSTSQPIRGQITSKVTETLSGGTFPSPSGMVFSVANGNTLSETLRLTSDGRGLSQFTAKAWSTHNQHGTLSVGDSHNISSITDVGIGNFRLHFSNNMGGTNYTWTGFCTYWGGSYNDASNMEQDSVDANNSNGQNNNNLTLHTMANLNGATTSTLTDMQVINVVVFGD